MDTCISRMRSWPSGGTFTVVIMRCAFDATHHT